MNPLEALMPSEIVFVTRYIETLDPVQSAKDANIRGVELQRRKPLARKPVQDAIKYLLAQRAVSMGVTKDVVLSGLLREAKGEFTKLGDDGLTQVSDSTPSSRVTAWRALGEYLQLFTQKIDVNVDGKIKVITGDVIDADKWEEIYTTDARSA